MVFADLFVAGNFNSILFSVIIAIVILVVGVFLGGFVSYLIKRVMSICDSPQENSGVRVDPTEYIYQSILSFFTLTYFRNKRGAVNWIKMVYNEFVKNGETEIFGNPNLPSPNEKKRIEMWRDAINDGLEFVKKKEESEIKKIADVINKIQDENESAENLLGMMGKL